MTDGQKELLMRRCVEENQTGDGYVLPIHLSLVAVSVVVAAMQLALRHPEFNGPTARVARGLIDQIASRLHHDGFEAHAQLIEVGNNPQADA